MDSVPENRELLMNILEPLLGGENLPFGTFKAGVHQYISKLKVRKSILSDNSKDFLSYIEKDWKKRADFN
jgi:hypothetical protein